MSSYFKLKFQSKVQIILKHYYERSLQINYGDKQSEKFEKFAKNIDSLADLANSFKHGIVPQSYFINSTVKELQKLLSLAEIALNIDDEKKNFNKNMKAIETLDFQQERQEYQIIQKYYKEIQKELQNLQNQINRLSSKTKSTKQTLQHKNAKMALKKRIDHEQQIKTIQNTIRQAQTQIQLKIQQSMHRYIRTNYKGIPIQFIKQNTKSLAKQMYSQIVQQVQKCYTSLGEINCIIQSLQCLLNNRKDVERKQNVKNKLKQLKPYLQSLSFIIVELSFQGKNIELSKIQFLCSLNQFQLFLQKNKKNLKFQVLMNIQNLLNSVKALRQLQNQIKNIDKNQAQISILMNKKKQYETDFYQYYQQWLNLKSRLKGISKSIIENISKFKQKLIQDETLFYQFDLVAAKSQKFLNNVEKIFNQINSLENVEKFNFQLLSDYLQF